MHTLRCLLWGRITRLSREAFCNAIFCSVRQYLQKQNKCIDNSHLHRLLCVLVVWSMAPLSFDFLCKFNKHTVFFVCGLLCLMPFFRQNIYNEILCLVNCMFSVCVCWFLVLARVLLLPAVA